MFLGINMFLALLRAHFNPRYARAKMILSRAKNIFIPANVNSIVILKLHIFKSMSLFISCELNIPGFVAFSAFFASVGKNNCPVDSAYTSRKTVHLKPCNVIIEA